MSLNTQEKHLTRRRFFAVILSISILCFWSCEDKNPYDDGEPKWLGESIYDYLKADGRFTYYLRIVDEVNEGGVEYSEILKTVGKTVFVAPDAAFETFFQSIGVSRFEDLTTAQKRAILFAGVLDNSYLTEMLSSEQSEGSATPTYGLTLRRTTALPLRDSIPYEFGDDLPNTTYWERFKEKGIHIMKDDSRWMMVHFLPAFMVKQGISNDDFSRIANTTRQNDDVFIFDIKIVQRDITCKNGYVNILEKVLFPVDNMAEYIRKNPDTQAFNRLLERYCAPYYLGMLTDEYGTVIDSLFEKRFFSPTQTTDPSNKAVATQLTFDPGRNDYSPTSNTATDMGVMFVPTDAALDAYFNTGEGMFLKDRYGSWENIPNDVLYHLINNHMRQSFLASTPSKFDAMEDKIGTKIGAQPDHIEYSKICSNGIVYVVNEVYPPTEFASVMAPVIMGENTKVFNWAINQYDFDLYLLSMENQFSFIVPTDEALQNYINPATLNSAQPERWKFWYNTRTARVNATRYKYPGTGDPNSDSIGVYTSGDAMDYALRDILDNHILPHEDGIVGESIESGKIFYTTKGGAVLKITGSGIGMKIEGGGDTEQGIQVTVDNIFPMKNGNTYMVNQALQMPLQSVYAVMSANMDFREFFNLCLEAAPYEITAGSTTTKYGGNIFTREGIDFNVDFFNTFNYTVYVPTNAAVLAAKSAGLIKDWDQIEAITDDSIRAVETENLYRFLRYHFQDNSVYITSETLSSSYSKEYQTATLDTSIDKFYKIKLQGDGSQLVLTTASGGTAHVSTTPGLYNLMCRDHKFGSSNYIVTSSYAVIHQIDSVLNFK
jgi:uncharacterized surface protein with fasciclin (FAS1) repeats